MKIICNDIEKYKSKVANEINNRIKNYKTKKVIYTSLAILFTIMTITGIIMFIYNDSYSSLSEGLGDYVHYPIAFGLGIISIIIFLLAIRASDANDSIERQNENMDNHNAFCEVLHKWKNGEIIMYETDMYRFRYYHRGDPKKQIYEVNKGLPATFMMETKNLPVYLEYEEESSIDFDNMVCYTNNKHTNRYEKITD